MPPKLGGLGIGKPKTEKQTQLFPYLEERDEEDFSTKLSLGSTFGKKKEKTPAPIPSSTYENENIKVLQEILKNMNSLSDKTIEGFSSVIDKINLLVPRHDDTDQCISLMLDNIDKNIAPSDIYIIVPGAQPSTISKDDLLGLIKDKNIHVVGSIREISLQASPKSHNILFSQAYEEEDDEEEE